MAEPIDSIVAAVRARNYRISLHYWNRLAERTDRPMPSVIEWGLAEDAPRLVAPDDGQDARGPRCRIECDDRDGAVFHVVVAYGGDRPGIVTAFYPDG